MIGVNFSLNVYEYLLLFALFCIPFKLGMILRCTDEWLVVVVVCLSGIRAAEGLTCTVHPQGDGSALYQISAPAKPNREYDWKINGMVVAHEDDSDGTIVLKHNGTFLLLKAHHSNTTYTVDTAEGRVSVPCYGPLSLGEPPHDDANKSNWGAILAGVVISLLALLVILPVGFCWWKKKGCFRKKKRSKKILRPLSS
ncbi:uncharacterized protein LOC116222395 isoform X2 [Clupea harengus]|uniref:Uncharacterized protein LOC116222395 isoform X2 n=1 Tax=Clupea harengus TaxID=7950 RepID=A0A6P8FZ45_CLUHA|nr:uncharacterized protein LOC116222395 isoform X2 [Clupea harengus]